MGDCQVVLSLQAIDFSPPFSSFILDLQKSCTGGVVSAGHILTLPIGLIHSSHIIFLKQDSQAMSLCLFC